MYVHLVQPQPGQIVEAPDVLPVVDFFQEWASARNFLDGRPVYTPQADSYKYYLPPVYVWPSLPLPPVPPDRMFIEVNAHPPTSVLLVLPLALLSYPNATLVWNLLSLGALALSGLIIIRQLNIRLAAWWLLPLTVLLLLNAPLQEQVRQGQLNLLLLLLLTGTWAADRSGWPVLAGVLLGTASAIKLFPAFLFLYFLLRKRWRVVVAGMAWGLLLTLGTAAVFGPQTYVSYVRDVIPQVNEWRSGWNNASLPGLFAKLFDPGSKHYEVTPLVHSVWLARLGTGISAMVIVALLTWNVPRARSLRDRDQSFAAFVTAMLLLAPMTWEHAFTIAVLPVAILWARSVAFSYKRRALLVLIVLLSIHPVTMYGLLILEKNQQLMDMQARPVQTLVVLSIQSYALLAMFGLGMAGLGRRGESADDQSAAAS
jgi:hypothetical protein